MTTFWWSLKFWKYGNKKMIKMTKENDYIIDTKEPEQ